MAEIEGDPQINLDLHVAQNLQNQLYHQGRIQMRYKQLKWANAFFIVKNSISCFLAIVCMMYQLIIQYSTIADLFLLLTIVAFGITNTYDLVQNLRRKIPTFVRYRINPNQYDKLTCSQKIIRIMNIILSLTAITISLSLIVVEQDDTNKQNYYLVVLVVMLCLVLFILVLYSLLITVFVAIWAIFGIFLVFFLLISLTVWLCSCGKVNFFKKCVPMFRRRQRFLIPTLNRTQIDFEKLTKAYSKKWLQLSKLIVSKEETFGHQTECSICLCPFEDDQDVLGLPCQQESEDPVHFFHTQPCSQQWFKEHSNCPMCRADYSTKFSKS